YFGLLARFSAATEVHAAEEVLAITAQLGRSPRCRIGNREGRLETTALAARGLPVHAHGRAVDLDGVSRLTHDAPDHPSIVGARLGTEHEIPERGGRQAVEHDEIAARERRRDGGFEVRIVVRDAAHAHREEPQQPPDDTEHERDVEEKAQTSAHPARLAETDERPRARDGSRHQRQSIGGSSAGLAPCATSSAVANTARKLSSRVSSVRPSVASFASIALCETTPMMRPSLRLTAGPPLSPGQIAASRRKRLEKTSRTGEPTRSLR